MHNVFDNSLRFGAGIGLLIGGSLLLVGAVSSQLLFPPPTYNQLKQISGRLEGIVEAHSSSKGSSWAQMRLSTPERRICTTIPRFGYLKTQQTGLALLRLEPGTPLTVMLDREERVVWEVRTQQTLLLPYATTVEADLNADRRMACLGLGSLMSGVFCLLWSWRRQKTRTQIFF